MRIYPHLVVVHCDPCIVDPCTLRGGRVSHFCKWVCFFVDGACWVHNFGTHIIRYCPGFHVSRCGGIVLHCPSQVILRDICACFDFFLCIDCVLLDRALFLPPRQMVGNGSVSCTCPVFSILPVDPRPRLTGSSCVCRGSLHFLSILPVDPRHRLTGSSCVCRGSLHSLGYPHPHLMGNRILLFCVFSNPEKKIECVQYHLSDGFFPAVDGVPGGAVNVVFGISTGTANCLIVAGSSRLYDSNCIVSAAW